MGRLGAVIVVEYRVCAALDQLRVPDRSAPLDPDRLWAHTCFELFVGTAGERYVEHNFSPTGQVACFAFARYRERLTESRDFEVETSITRDATQLILRAHVELPRDTERLAPTVVLEHADGRTTYWALRHLGPRPDFHDRDAWPPWTNG